ncbi:RusA family crossover junction endodeoxyribonuclease [Myxococcaceae bacterium JPH2]|nr:RusA family crossover junction endodeoxyribonuclease [Myxococcaceae bacterium JPH2]
MNATLYFSLPYPPSANTYWVPARGRGLVPSDEAKAYKAGVAQGAALRRIQPLAGPVYISVTAFRPRRSGDLDNVLKVLCDSLNDVAWLDDDQVVTIHAQREDDPKNPRVEVALLAERYATPDEAAAHRQARAERAAKARATRNRNRAAKARGAFSSRLKPSVAAPRKPRAPRKSAP